jgi:hypothetical protein
MPNEILLKKLKALKIMANQFNETSIGIDRSKRLFLPCLTSLKWIIFELF